jgi:ferric-chelate reductase
VSIRFQVRQHGLFTSHFLVLTGISHEKLNVFHRALGRTVFILIWMHSIGHILNGKATIHTFQRPFMLAGLISFVGMSAVVTLSIRPVRNALYEFFLISHILTVL